jgi:predicted dehydrogenase
VSLRVLITGAGSIAKRHANNLLLVRPDAAVMVLTRQPSVRLADWPAGVTAVGTFEDGLKAGANAVMVCGASAKHAREVLDCIRLGLPMFVEKPLLTREDDLAKVSAAIGDAHPASVIGCNLRFLHSLVMLRAALADGMAGRLVRSHLEVGQWLPDWRPGRPLDSSYSSDVTAGGGVVFDLVHEIDAACWLLGSLSLVNVVGGQLSSLTLNAPDTAVALLRDAAGCPVTLSLDYVSRRPVRRYVFVGDRGTLLWDLQQQQLSLASEHGNMHLSVEPKDFAVADTYRAELVEWLAAMDTSKPPPTCPLASSLAATDLMLQIARGLP